MEILFSTVLKSPEQNLVAVFCITIINGYISLSALKWFGGKIVSQNKWSKIRSFNQPIPRHRRIKLLAIHTKMVKKKLTGKKNVYRTNSTCNVFCSKHYPSLSLYHWQKTECKSTLQKPKELNCKRINLSFQFLSWENPWLV